MEEQLECQFKDVYAQLSFNEADTAKIAEGQYPIILAKDGAFTKLYVNSTELNNYSIWDALDADAEAQHELHGENIPIVWQADGEGGMFETGMQHKVIESAE